MSRHEGSVLAGIFGDIEYRPTQSEPKQFMPWHKPRKQFVRREQWCALLRRLYEERRPDEPLRYLGLPGTDLIDLRYLYEELCRPEGRPLRFLGFNTVGQPGSPAHIELKISLDEVRRLSNVDPRSDVIPDDFRRIGDEASLAWSRVRSLGPYDVINIDLCDGLASDPPPSPVYKAIARLLALQARNDTPWLLLVTTRIGRGMFDAEVEELLMDLFRRNVSDCEGFHKDCQRFLELDVTSLNPEMCSDVDLLKLMIAAIGKWLAALVQAQAPSCVELPSTHGYKVNPAAVCEDLVSIALRFEPVIKAPMEALSPSLPTSNGMECDNAKRILRRSAQRLDVDAILAERPDLNEELIDEITRLLAQARFDVTDYREWLAS